MSDEARAEAERQITEEAYDYYAEQNLASFVAGAAWQAGRDAERIAALQTELNKYHVFADALMSVWNESGTLTETEFFDRMGEIMVNPPGEMWCPFGHRVDELEAEVEHLRVRAEATEAKLAAVRELHYSVEGLHLNLVCAHRHCKDDSGDQVEWPCPTARATFGNPRYAQEV